MDGYADYLWAEWEAFERSPARAQVAAAAALAQEVRKVLDVGCGAGQELLPFVATRDVFGMGIDKAPTAAGIASTLFGRRQVRGRVRFVTGCAEQLPCRANVFDVVICRLALPYTHNASALAEMARVLRPGGLILIQFHHPSFYIHELMRALVSLRFKSALHDLAVLAAGTAYLATGRQPRARLIGGEVFQTERLLRREMAKCGLAVRAVAPTSNTQAPLWIAVKGEG